LEIALKTINLNNYRYKDKRRSEMPDENSGIIKVESRY
jgi:hypothetical protein